MISFIRGIIKQKTDKYLILETNNIGYKVFVNNQTMAALPKNGQEAQLYTYFHKTDNVDSLFGFLDFQDLAFFEELLSVPSVGPRSALNVMSIGDVDKIKTAILSNDEDYLTKAPGVGGKMAKKIILELVSKIRIAPGGFMPEILKEETEIIDALVGMGYKKYEVAKALKILSANIFGVEKKIRELLKILGKKR